MNTNFYARDPDDYVLVLVDRTFGSDEIGWDVLVGGRRLTFGREDVAAHCGVEGAFWLRKEVAERLGVGS